MIWSPAITAVLIGIIAAFSFGGGFALGDWRMSSRIERLEHSHKGNRWDSRDCDLLPIRPGDLDETTETERELTV